MTYYKKDGGIAQEISPTSNFFKDKSKEKYTTEQVKEYLLEVVSGTLYPTGTEHGEMRVSFEKLQELVEEGYNIVKVLNAEELTPYNIYIEYQRYDKEDKYNKEFRRRF